MVHIEKNKKELGFSAQVDSGNEGVIQLSLLPISASLPVQQVEIAQAVVEKQCASAPETPASSTSETSEGTSSRSVVPQSIQPVAPQPMPSAQKHSIDDAEYKLCGTVLDDYRNGRKGLEEAQKRINGLLKNPQQQKEIVRFIYRKGQEDSVLRGLINSLHLKKAGLTLADFGS